MIRLIIVKKNNFSKLVETVGQLRFFKESMIFYSVTLRSIFSTSIICDFLLV